MRNDPSIPARKRSGFTLIEVVLAAGVLAIILIGMQSAMVLASKAAPDRTNGISTVPATARAIDRLSADLGYATAISSATATSITFTVPDRTGDGAAETIAYSWSGQSGDPLLRTINGRAATKVATNVTEFQLTCDRKTQQRSTTYTESSEILLNSYDPLGLLNLGAFTVTSNAFIGEYFLPTLPANATKWRVTRVQLKASKDSGNTGVSRVQLRTMRGSSPGTVIEEKTLLESSLSSSFVWQTFNFSNVSGLTPGTALCLVVQWASDDEACDIQYQPLLALPVNANLLSTSNGGQTWSAGLTQSIPFYVYGTYSTTDATAYDYSLNDVRCTLRCGSDTSTRVRSTIRLLNQPTVSGP